MVGKLPNCSQARRSRTEERKRDLWIRQSPPRCQSRAMLQAPSLNAASEGWMSENQILLADRKKYFFLDIPFYRTLPTVLGNRQRAAITTFPPHDDYGHFYFAEIRTFERFIRTFGDTAHLLANPLICC